MNINISNVHLDLGAGRRGTDMGPSALYVAGLSDAITKLGHQITETQNIGMISQEALEIGNPKARFLPIVKEVCEALSDTVEQAMEQGSFPLALGGDHAQAIGTISGLAKYYRREKQNLGVIWVDAHTDMNTPETSPSGNIHGMPLATLLGYGAPQLLALNGTEAALKAENVAVFGARAIDISEIPLVEKTGLRVYTMSEIDSRGMRVCLDEAIDKLVASTDGIHLSFDLDGVDPTEAPGVGTPVPGGLSFRESHLLCERLCRSQKLRSMELVELNPTLDFQNKTAKLAVWLIQSALGRTII